MGKTGATTFQSRTIVESELWCSNNQRMLLKKEKVLIAILASLLTAMLLVLASFRHCRETADWPSLCFQSRNQTLRIQKQTQCIIGWAACKTLLQSSSNLKFSEAWRVPPRPFSGQHGNCPSKGSQQRHKEVKWFPSYLEWKDSSLDCRNPTTLQL